ncbi:MAG: AAA family ATPase [Treponema sp.]|nr:AAA family ATPase [Treponema sp.]
MGERVDNKELFKEWLCKQHKQDGNVYSANTISAYCSALSKSPEKLEGIDDDCKRSIFVYDDVGEFSIVHEIIKKAPNFDEVNKAAGNQAFKYGMIKYQEFLQQNSQGDPTMTQDNTLLDKYTKLLKNTHNLILTGAPGTGKTYLAKQIAEKMGCTPDEIGFVQFHPSYDYTDFVEGLRPVQDESGSGQIGFERKDGVFKEFCGRALQNLVDSRKSVDVLQHEKTINEIVEDFLNDAVSKKTQFETITKNVFYVDSFTDRKVLVSIPQNEKVKTLPVSLDDILELMSNNVQLDIGKDVSEYFNRKWRTQQDSYIYVLTKQLQEIVRKNKNNTASTIEKVQAKNFVFIIDEINRGEVSKIFGELFYSVDSGYRVSAQDLEAVRAKEKQFTTIKTQYANLETTGNAFDRALGSADYGHFFIPENVFIIGTMNDIDRSVESMDFAFRRRFTWVEVKAEDTQYMLDEKVDENGQTQGLPDSLAQEAKERMNRLNKAIDEIRDLNSAYHIGASYFLKLNEYDGDFNKLLKKLWDYHLKGLLHEYLRGSGNEATGMEILEKAYFGEEERLDKVYFHSNQEQ